MARFCATDGITHIFATPHCHRYVHLLKAVILPQVTLLNEQLNAAEIPVTILPGSEIQVTDTNEYRREFETGVFCHLGDGRDYTLLEFNWAREQFPSDAAALVSWIRAQNMTPILAHPERHDSRHVLLQHHRAGMADSTGAPRVAAGEAARLRATVALISF